MIRITENPKKRFNISNKFAFYQKQISSKKKLTIDFHSKYEQHINKLHEQLVDSQKKYESLAKSGTNSKTLTQLKRKIDKQEFELKETIELSKKGSSAETISVKNVKYTAKNIRLGYLYKIQNLWLKILAVSLIGIVVSVIVWLLVQYTGVYTAGLSGVIQGLAKIVKLMIEQQGPNYEDLSNIVYNTMFWVLYFVINIPLIIFAYYKINKQFAILSAVFIAVSRIVGFGLGFANNGEGVFIFTNMDNIAANAPGFIEGIQLLPWNTGESIVLGIFIYSSIYAIISGIAYSAIYILGSSSGGMDFFGFYYSKVKNKSVGKLLTIFNVVSLIVGVTIGSFVCWMIEAPKHNITLNETTILSALFSPNLIASVLGSIISGILYNIYFPRNKVVKVQVYSDKVGEVANALNVAHWNYKLIIGQSKEDILQTRNDKSQSLETICIYIDVPTLMSTVRSIDPESLISIYSPLGFDGELPTTSYGK